MHFAPDARCVINTKKTISCFHKKTANSKGNRPFYNSLYKTFQIIIANS